jgi:hypothetical protein
MRFVGLLLTNQRLSTHERDLPPLAPPLPQNLDIRSPHDVALFWRIFWRWSGSVLENPFRIPHVG